MYALKKLYFMKTEVTLKLWAEVLPGTIDKLVEQSSLSGPVFGRSSRGARPPCFFGSFRVSFGLRRIHNTLFALSSSVSRRASTGHLGAPPGGERTNLSASRHLWSNPCRASSPFLPFYLLLLLLFCGTPDLISRHVRHTWMREMWKFKKFNWFWRMIIF